MKRHTVTLYLEIPDEIYTKLEEAHNVLDKDGSAGDFNNFMHDIVDFRILRHMAENTEIMLDWQKHFCDLIQT